MDLIVKWEYYDNESTSDIAKLKLESKDGLLSWEICVELKEICRDNYLTHEDSYGSGPWIKDNRLWKRSQTTAIKWNDFDQTTTLSKTQILTLGCADDVVKLEVSDAVAKRLMEDFTLIHENKSFEPVFRS